MNRNYQITFYVLLFIAALAMSVMFFFSNKMHVLNPSGEVAIKQRDLLVIATCLMLIIVIPVFIMTFSYIWEYRASNKEATYSPDWDNSLLAELIWWGFPFAIVILLSIITYQSSHDLDPFKPLVSPIKPITIQAVSLEWKWLFIYPEHNIATVNYIQFPEETPINFEITSDAPMNSLWIPQLGGMIYAMPGMHSKLHLIANSRGDFAGSSGHLSGTGFAGMKFIARSSTEDEFNDWVKSVQQSSNKLTLEEYNNLVTPTENNPVALYQLSSGDLFDKIIMKYRTP